MWWQPLLWRCWCRRLWERGPGLGRVHLQSRDVSKERLRMSEDRLSAKEKTFNCEKSHTDPALTTQEINTAH